jgi:hypothetical protein
VVDCEFTDDDTEPSYLDLPIQTAFGTGNFSAFAGSALASTFIFLVIPSALLTAIAFAARRWPAEVHRLAPFQRRIVSNVVFMALGYMGPNICYSFVLVAAHDGNPYENLSVIVAGLIVLVIIITIVHVLRRFAAFFRTVSAAHGALESRELVFENTVPSSMMFESFGTTFDAARSTAGIVRVYFLEELLTSILLQSLSGIRPRSGLCGPVAVSMAVVAAFHVLYLLLVRPYASKLELGFSVVGAVLLLVLLAVVINLINGSGFLLSSLAVVTLMENILFFVQMVVMAVAVLASQHKKRLEQHWEVDLPMKDVAESLLLPIPESPESLGQDNRQGIPLLSTSTGNSVTSPSSLPMLSSSSSSSSISPPPLNVKTPALVHNPLLTSSSNSINF